ncbi:MAG: hypothetical protein LC792_15725, partial [Actinobacteria bacterium]|nr:hypothetical protein [Actinomycetota bacterium]
PRPITAFFPRSAIHGFGVSEDGTRLYLAYVNPDLAGGFLDGRGNATAANGLGIYDISEIQTRKTTPQVRLLGQAGWMDGMAAQHAIPISSGGRPYVVDELSHGGPRIIDISKETEPRIVSKLKTEIQMPENRDVANRDTRRPG